ALTAHQRQHGRNAESFALPAPRHIDIGSPSIFQREANELAAALDFRPVEELVRHGARLLPIGNEARSMPPKVRPCKPDPHVTGRSTRASPPCRMAPSSPLAKARGCLLCDLP